MNQSRLRNPYASPAIYLILTLLIGIIVVLLPLNAIECNLVLNLQNFAQKTVGLQAFQVLTYLGDFYVWIISASIYLLYAYSKSRKYIDSAVELAVFLVITTALTFFIKVVFVRPRPNCPGISVYNEDVLSSFSYPSGHVSRATGAYLILSKGSRTKESMAVIAIFTVSLSRIILGAHYLTDVVGGIFLSIAAQKLANLSLPFLARFHAYKMDNNRRKEKTSTKNENCKFRVLFVCTGNGYRSPICEALLKKLRSDLEVDSAGTRITRKITKEAREYVMSEDAMQYLKKKPESIDGKQLEQYDIIIIAMEKRHRDSVLKKCPECKNKVVIWNVRDKIPFLHRRTEKINEQMKKNVTEYAESLA